LLAELSDFGASASKVRLAQRKELGDEFAISMDDDGFIAADLRSGSKMVASMLHFCTAGARSDHSLTNPRTTPQLDAKFLEVVWWRPRRFLGSGACEGTRFRGTRLIDGTMARTDHSCSTETRNGRRYPRSAPALVMSCESRHHTFREQVERANQFVSRSSRATPLAHSRFQHHGAHP
jgi:hypothetical protein